MKEERPFRPPPLKSKNYFKGIEKQRQLKKLKKVKIIIQTFLKRKDQKNIFFSPNYP